MNAVIEKHARMVHASRAALAGCLRTVHPLDEAVSALAAEVERLEAECERLESENAELLGYSKAEQRAIAAARNGGAQPGEPEDERLVREFLEAHSGQEFGADAIAHNTGLDVEAAKSAVWQVVYRGFAGLSRTGCFASPKHPRNGGLLVGPPPPRVVAGVEDDLTDRREP